MEGDILKSTIEPFSIDVIPLDFIFNHHFTRKVSFRDRLDPLSNDYLIGFWLAVFCTTMTGNENEIDDVLFGILGGNSGFKSLTILPNGADGGKELLLLRNFFFNSDSQQIKHGGISKREREQIILMLGREIEETSLQYLVYDISGSGCANQSDRMRHQPYMEPLLNLEPGDDNEQGQVEKFFSLKDFVNLPRDLLHEAFFLKNEGHNDDNVKNIIRLVKGGLKKGAMKELTASFDKPFEYGFTHGFLFSTYTIHKLDVKVHGYGKEKRYVSLTLQKQTFLEDLRDFRPAASYDIVGEKKMVDKQEDFKQKITQVVAKWGNKEEAGKLLSGYVQSLTSFVEAFTLKYRGKFYMRTYLRGMFMSWPGPSYDYADKSPFYDVYTIKENMQIVLRVQYGCLIVFNFDDKMPLDVDSLKLWKFKGAIKDKCVWIISIFEIEMDCSMNLLDNNVIYRSNITLMDFTNFKKDPDLYAYEPLYETNFVRSLLLRLDFSDEKSLNSIYRHFQKFILTVRDVLKHDKAALFYILEGLFHDKSSYFNKTPHKRHQIDQFRSSTAYCVRIKTDKKIMQINFLSIVHLTEYMERIDSVEPPRENYDRQVINFFYKYDQNTGNFSSHMKVGLDFGSEIFTNSTCYDSTENEVQCPPYKTLDRPKRRVLQEPYGIFMDIFDKLRQNDINTKKSNALALEKTFTNLIIDDLRDPFYLIGDFIWTKILIHDTKAFVDSIKTIKTAWKLTKITLKAVASGTGVPIVGVVLGAMDTIDAWRNYQNGDTSAFAIYNIGAGAVFFTTSLISLTIGILTLAGFAVVPVLGWVVFAVGTVFFVAGHIWKIIADPEAFKQFCVSSWEFIKSIPAFLSHPIEFLESEQVQESAKVVNGALEILENNTIIRNIFSTPICNENRGHHHGCHDIYINFDSQYRILKKDVLSDTPNIPIKFANKYKKLCVFQTGLGLLIRGLKTLHDPHGSVIDYECVNALGVGRISDQIVTDPVSLYLLHGNSSVHAVRDTVSIFRLSGGEWCRIVGGHRGNHFMFSSSFQKCLIVGHAHSVNTVDLSGVGVLKKYKIINSTSLEGVDDDTQLKSVITMKNINVITSQQHFGYSDFTIICSNVSIVFNERKQEMRHLPLYRIIIESGHGCPYDLEITSHGSVALKNHATKGKTVYTFPDVTGDVDMLLNNNRGRMTHSIMWKSISITDIRNVLVEVLNLDRITRKISFIFKKHRVVLTLRDGTNSTQQMFADGSELTFKNNTFVVDILFPKSKGQLWHTYGVLFDYFEGSSLELNAYSERDDEFFVLTKNEIRFNQTVMPFSLFESNYDKSVDRQTINCKSGYNIILVTTSCCEGMQHILEKRAPWFDSLTVEMAEKPDVLIFDFTPLIDSDNRFKNKYTMDIMLTENFGEEEVILDVFALSWNENLTEKYLAGTIKLNSNLISDMLYKKIRITAKSNFILKADDLTNRLSVVPLPHVVCPLSPVVVLDRHSVEKNQVILFGDRLLPNYDLVKLDDSTLLITDLASNMAKSLIISPASVPLLSVIIKNYKDSRMRTLTLKFERGLKMNMDQLDENQMLTYHEFETRLLYITDSIAEEGFSLEHDTRFDTSRKSVLSPPVEKVTNKPRAKSKPKTTRHPLWFVFNG